MNKVPIWSLGRRVSEVGYPDLPLLSVYRDYGVVPREGRDDNHNRASEDLSTYQRVLPGDLVLNKMKTWQGSLGVSKYEGIVSPAYFVFRLDAAKCEPKYMHHLLRSSPYVHKYRAASKGIRPQQWDLPWDAFRAISVPLPSRHKQEQVADFLDDQIASMTRVLSSRDRQMSAIYARRDAAVRAILTGENRSDLASTASKWFPRLPALWRAMQLKYRWQVIDCKHRTPAYRDSGYPVISTGDVTPGRLDLSRATRFIDHADFVDLADPLRRPVRGDIVYSRNASLGTASYVDTDAPFSMGQDVCRITSKGDQLFLTHALNYLVGDQVAEESIGSTFKRINIDRIRRLELPVPPPIEQTAIAAQADRVIAMAEKAVDAIKRSRNLILERRHALVAEAVSGQFDVTTARVMA